MTLSREKLARARWAGWEAARELLRHDGPWRVWLETHAWRDRLHAGEAPGSIRVEAATVHCDSDETALEAASVMAEALLDAVSQRAAVGRDLLDGRLLAIGANRWYVLEGGRLVPSRSETGDLRSVGAILLVLGDHAGQTLNAAGRTLRSRLPISAGGLYDAMAQPPDPGQRAAYVGRLDHIADVLTLTFRDHLIALCDGALPGWALVPAEACADGLGRALCAAAGVDGSELVVHTQGKGQIRKHLLPDAETTGSRSSSVRDRDEKYESWRDRQGWTEVEDSALASLFASESGFPKDAGVRDFFARNRVRAYRLHEDAHNHGKRDFARLAPLPLLGSKRPQAQLSPGLPILDALWAVRSIQEALPGLVGRDGPVRVVRVAFALRSTSESGDDSSARGLPGETRYPLVGDAGDLALRPFGVELLSMVATDDHLSRVARQYYVCVTLEDDDGRIELPVAFPWRFERPSRADHPDDSADLRSDRERLAKVSRQVEELANNAPVSFRPPLRSAMEQIDELCAAFAAYREGVRECGFGAMAGLHVAEGTIWPVAERYLDAFDAALEAFVGLFREAGDLAPRIAGGPLDTLLRFGLESTEGDDGAASWRIREYHPIRLRRLQALEAEAYRELLDALAEPGTLRDVPITSVPTIRGGPAVLWTPGAMPGNAKPAFLVPPRIRLRRDQGRGPWTESYEPFAHERSREPDLIGPVRPLLYALANALFPGMARRMRVRMDASSRSDRGLRPMLLLADAVMREGGNTPRVTAGVDLRVAGAVDISALEDLGALVDDADLEQLQTILRALTTPREDDPRFPLEIQIADPDDDAPDHLVLLVNPWSSESEWVVRLATDGLDDSPAMTWEPVSQSWERLMLNRVGGSSAAERQPQQLEQRFQELVIRRWRRESDGLARCLGLSLEANPDHPLGGRLLRTHVDAARRSLRVLLVDHTVGAEAFDEVPQAREQLRVTLADFDRATGWRTTLFCRNHDDAKPDREELALGAGLANLLPDASDDLAHAVYHATYRAVPEVTRYLWRHAARPVLQKDAELVGHLGVALFASTQRSEIRSAWPGDFDRLRAPMPPGTILLSMDALQRWTWTRRSGTRGDFLAVVPDRDDENCVRILAIESKGSAEANLYQGTRQAAVALRKLRTRFEGKTRWAERQELMRCLAEEAFRTTTDHRVAHDRIARAYREPGARIEFSAVCVSTCLAGDGMNADTLDEGGTSVLWLKVAGATGLEGLAGIGQSDEG